MRKLVLLSALVGLFSSQVKAAYSPVTAGAGGNQVVNGVTVSVSNAGPGSLGAFPTNFCSAGPYYIGGSNSQNGGYRYDFAPNNKVTHVRLSFADFQSDDTVYLNVNGTSFPITNAMVTPNAVCADVSNFGVFGGQLVCNAPAGTRTDAVVTFVYGPGFIQNLEVHHDHKNSGSGGVVYGLEIDVDSCGQLFNIAADSPACSKRDLKLTATGFPNTTYAWTSTNGFTSSVQNPTHMAVPYSATPVSYYCVATRGACTYRDTVIVNIDLTPDTTKMKFQGPKCKGDKDSVYASSNIGSGGYYVFIKPDGSTEIPSIAPFNFIELPNIQLADAGLYRSVAVTTKGCVSDTGSLVLTLNPVVIADFSFDNTYGCDVDSIEFFDASLGNNTWLWTFGDGNSSTDQNPVNVYKTQPATYTVKLVVSNGKCFDSTTKLLSLNHPLVADFDISADSICQGGTVTFTNNSVATPATIPTYFWDFKDGSVDSQYNMTHKFLRYGVYSVSLTIKDYLGCKKTATRLIVVDSLGSASFFSDTVICAGESIQFLGDYSEIGGTFAEWDFADGHKIQNKFVIEHAFINPGTYNVLLTAHYRICPETPFNQNIYVKPYPEVNLGPDTSLCPNGESFVIKDLVNVPSGALKWKWNTITKDTTSSIVVHHPGKYAVTVEQDGCAVSDTIEVKKNCYIDIPNVFTPNGDGYNDYFLPRQLLSKSVTKFNMVIYNRWGAQMFETSKVDGRGWDGKVNDKPQPTGVYVYMIKVEFANGTNENYQGNVTLLR